jgi:hypothetical protein
VYMKKKSITLPGEDSLQAAAASSITEVVSSLCMATHTSDCVAAPSCCPCRTLAELPVDSVHSYNTTHLLAAVP